VSAVSINVIVALDRKVFAVANVLHNKMNSIKISVNLLVSLANTCVAGPFFNMGI
jgi:hypothetical protein